jgi:protein TonB
MITLPPPRQTARKSAAASSSRPPAGPPRPSAVRRAGRGVAVLVLGVGLAFLVFLALPFMQFIDSLGKKDLVVRSIDAVQPPPPPPVIEETPPEEAPEPQEPPPSMAEPNLSLADLSSSLNPSLGGEGFGALVKPGGAPLEKKDWISSGDADVKPRAIQQQPPKYPATLKKSGVKGRVVIACVIDARGNVVSPRVEKSIHPELDRNALEAVKSWRFEPGKREGRSVAVRVNIPIVFDA